MQSLLGTARALLQTPRMGPVLRSRLFMLLYRLAAANPALRRAAASASFDLCAGVHDNLRAVLEQRLGPQNLIDALRLMQLLTYGTKFTVGKWTYALLDYCKEEMCVHRLLLLVLDV